MLRRRLRLLPSPRVAAVFLTLAAALAAVSGQDRKQGRVRVDHYVIDAEVNPATQTLTANVQARVIPLEDNQTTAVFELHNSLNLTRVVDSEGRQIGVSRSQEDFTADRKSVV